MISIFRFWKQMAAVLKLYSQFQFDPTVVIGIWLCIGLPILYELDDMWQSCDVMSISKMAATASQIYSRFRLWWRTAIKNVDIYLHTKFRQRSSIRGRDSTISGFWKHTAAIMKFYFRFRFNIFIVIGVWFCVGVSNWPSATRPIYDVIAIFKMAAVSHVGFAMR